jgi:predicted transcriptional regulator
MLLEVIGSKKRLMILKSLSRREMCVSELMDELKMDGKSAKYHLDLLEKYGLVESRVVGKRKYYILKKEIKLEISPPPYRKFTLIAVDKE